MNRRGGVTRLHWLAVGSFHRYRCHGFAIFLWRYSQADYREVVPQYVPSSSPALENRALPAQPGLATVQAAAVDTASPQPAALAQSAPEGAAPTTAGLSPELTQLLQSMTRDLATVGQESSSSRPAGTDGPRQCERRRAAQGHPGKNGPRRCQGFRAESTAHIAPPLRPIATRRVSLC